MGQIFTWEAVRQGHIPQLDSFTKVVDTLRREIPDIPSIVSALVCGSVIRGDHTIRSDIDCFVVYDHKREHEAFCYMQQATAYAATLHVPLGFIPCDTLLAHTRMHHVGTSFRQHLKKSVDAGGGLKGDPLAHFKDNLPVQDELESYMRVKMYNLQEAWAQTATFSEERMVSYLRKLLEAPLHIARKVLAHKEPLENDSKLFIQKQYLEVMPTALSRELEFLVRLDEYYTVILKRVVLDPDEALYRYVLRDLCNSSEEVLQFIRSNLAFVADTPR